jgi:hypothetical protein
MCWSSRAVAVVEETLAAAVAAELEDIKQTHRTRSNQARIRSLWAMAARDFKQPQPQGKMGRTAFLIRLRQLAVAQVAARAVVAGRVATVAQEAEVAPVSALAVVPVARAITAVLLSPARAQEAAAQVP